MRYLHESCWECDLQSYPVAILCLFGGMSIDFGMISRVTGLNIIAPALFVITVLLKLAK